MIDKIKKLLNEKADVERELIDTYECRIMGKIDTYNVTLNKHDFTYAKSVVNKGVGAGCVFPIDSRGIIALETQYRFNLRDLLVELPAGRMDEGEDFFACAKRELKEETGLVSDNMKEQCVYYIQPDFSNEELGAYLALDVKVKGDQELDSDESVNVLAMPFDVCEELINRNIINDERTIIGFGLAKVIDGIDFTKTTNKDQVISQILKRIEEDKVKLKEEEVDVSYTYVCEFGFARDHIVKTPKLINTRRECMYMKSGKMVIPVSKKGKIGLKVAYMPAVDKKMVELPVYEEFAKDSKFEEFGKLYTAIGYANDYQDLFILKDLSETKNYIWCTVDEVKELIKEKMITDGKVLAALLKYLVSLN